MKYIDNLINKISMYRLVSIGLLVLALIAVLFGYTGVLSLSGTSLLISLLIVMISGIATDQVFSRIFGFASNEGSSMITALIIFFIFFPVSTVQDGAILALVTAIAIASKYIIVRNKRHLLNPAAIAAVIIGITGLAHATWWVGSSVLLPFLLLLGMLILRKLHRFQLFFVFFGVALTCTLLREIGSGQATTQIIIDAVASSPLLFLGTIMLTEPSTLPTRHRHQLLYAAIVGALCSLPIPTVTPEIALVVGNVFGYAVSPALRSRHVLRFKQASKLTDSIIEYSFDTQKPLQYKAGQYIDITMPAMAMDFKGNRRSFTVSSAPSEKTVTVTIRNSDSTFKKALETAKPGALFFADGPSGNFILPKPVDKPLVWVAGGIGVTPFISMAKDMMQRGETRSITLIYVGADTEDFVYTELLKQVPGLTVVYCIGRQKLYQTLQNAASQQPDSLYYVSGPQAMVIESKSVLKNFKISQKNIITDYFSGY